MKRSILTSCTVGVLGLALVGPTSIAHAAENAAPAATSRTAPDAQHELAIVTKTFLPGEKVTVTGSANPGQRVSVHFANPDHPNDLQSATAAADGSWTATSSTWVQTAADLTVTAQSASDAVEQTLTAIERILTVDTQSYRAGEVATVGGTANPGVFVVVNLPGTWNESDNGRVTADRSGRWSFTGKVPVHDRNAVVRVSTGFGDFSKTVEKTLTASDLTLSVDSTTYVAGLPVTLDGSADPGATVSARFSGDGPNSDSAVVGGDGRWSLTSRFPVTEEQSTKVAVTSRSGETERAVEHTLTAVAPTLEVGTTTYRPGQLVTISGRAEPNTRVSARFAGHDGPNAAITDADPDGKWSITSPFPVTERPTTTVVVKTAFGGTGKTVEQQLTAETAIAPITVTTTTFVKGQRQKIEGTAQPGARVDVYSGSKYLMNVTANASGKWNYTTGSAITGDTFTRTLKSAGTDDVTFTLTAEEATVAPITVTTTTFVRGQKQQIEGTAQPGARVNVYSGNAYETKAVADADGKWSYTTATALAEDSYTRTVQSDGADLLTFTLQSR